MREKKQGAGLYQQAVEWMFYLPQRCPMLKMCQQKAHLGSPNTRSLFVLLLNLKVQLWVSHFLWDSLLEYD